MHQCGEWIYLGEERKKEEERKGGEERRKQWGVLNVATDWVSAHSCMDRQHGSVHICVHASVILGG